MTLPPKIAILNTPTAGWGQQLLSGILKYVKEHSTWELWVETMGPDVFERLPKDWAGDGVIGRIITPQMAAELKSRGIPVVNVSDSDLVEFSAPTVRADDHVGAKFAFDHFFERGVRHFAFVGPCNLPSQKRYADIFKKLCIDAGYECHLFSAAGKSAEEFERLTQWIQMLPKPTGLLGLGYEWSRIVVNTCRSANMEVPHDVSVLCSGYDELLSYTCYPTLSGIQPPTKQIGYEAAALMDRMLKGETVSNETIYIPSRGVIERLSTDTFSVNDPNLELALEYIHDHAFEKFTTQGLLDQVPMSRRSLERHFQSTFGHSIADEVKRIRIKKARDLLVDTDLVMQDIAEACGYASYNSLSSIFKKATGIAPSVYRKRYRE